MQCTAAIELPQPVCKNASQYSCNTNQPVKAVSAGKAPLTAQVSKKLRRTLINNLQVSGADWLTSELRYGLLPLTRRGLSSVCEPFLGGTFEPDAGFDFSSVRFGIGIIAGLTLLFGGAAWLFVFDAVVFAVSFASVIRLVSVSVAPSSFALSAAASFASSSSAALGSAVVLSTGALAIGKFVGVPKRRFRSR